MSEGIRNIAKARVLARCTAEKSELTALREHVKVLREALALAKGFIKNGLDFGYITPPEPGDPACDILNDICKALDQAKPKDGE